MPPRHAYWTILVDNQPTAFRAHDPEELQPTLNRLKEKHPSAVMMWFERGRLWESRDAARVELPARGERRGEGSREERGERRREQHSREAGDEPQRPRDRHWRPGGDHKDPRQKYKDAKKAKWQRFKQNIRARHDDRMERSGPPGEAAPPPPRSQDRPAPDRADQRRDGWRRDDRPRSEWRDGPRDDRRTEEKGTRSGWKPKGPRRQGAEFNDRGERPDRGSWQERERTGGNRPHGHWRDDRASGWRPKGPPAGRDNRYGREEQKPWPKRESPADEWRDRPARRNDRAKPEWRDRAKSEWHGRDRPKPDWRESRGTGDRRDDRRFEDKRAPAGRTGDRRPWGTKPGTPKSGGRKPWGSKPPGARPTGRKPFGTAGGRRGPGAGTRGPRMPKKPRDDE